MQEFATDRVEKTHDIARNLFWDLEKNTDKAKIITFSGELGAGKTELIRGLLRAAGVDGPITSPTYTIEKPYKLTEGPFDTAYHLDAYRLESGQDLLELSFTKRLESSDNLILIEWPEKVEGALPEDVLAVAISIQNNKRVIKISNE